MPTSTYDLLASNVLGSNTSSVTFSSIPSTYRDLVLVVKGAWNQNSNGFIQLNGDTTSSNYSTVAMGGSGFGTNTTYDYSAWLNYYNLLANNQSMWVVNFLDYSTTNKQKPILTRTGAGAGDWTQIQASRWGNTSAITSITVLGNGSSFIANTSFYLYGIVG